MEEEKYLYPTDGVSQVECGENYKDYLLSDVLERSGYELIWKRFVYASYQPEGAPTNEDIAKSYVSGCFILIGGVVKDGEAGIITIAPVNRCHRMPGIRTNDVNPVDKSCGGYSDVRIRYYTGRNGDTLRPVWVAFIDDNGKEYCSVGPEIAEPYNIIKGDLVVGFTSALTIETEGISVPTIYL